jgi:hypothetical protein
MGLAVHGVVLTVWLSGHDPANAGSATQWRG